MTKPSDKWQTWSPDPRHPDDPEFYRRVLDHVPMPIVVVNDQGVVIYGNQAVLGLSDWGYTEGQSILDFVHPDDHGPLAEAFVKLLDSPESRVLGNRRPWSEVLVHAVDREGTTIPVEIMGTGGLLDPAVGGLIYTVRPAHNRDLLSRVLDGLSQGASMHQLLTHVCELITRPPIDLQAVILQSTTDDTFVVAASTSLQLTDVFRRPLPALWESSTKRPTATPVEEMPQSVRKHLADLGFVSFWHVAVESPLTPTSLRIIAAAPSRHDPDRGPVDRMNRAKELAAAILLRSQTDVLLDHAADYDHLTGLPNRARFNQLADALDPTTERASLHFDLDGLSIINSDLGQASGDAVLQVVADRLRGLGEADDVLGRIGDDEFCLILVNQVAGETLLDRGVRLAKAARDAILEPIVVAGRPLSVSASIGLACAEPGVPTDELMTWANTAMGDAKRAGGGRIHRFGVTFGQR